MGFQFGVILYQPSGFMLPLFRRQVVGKQTRNLYSKIPSPRLEIQNDISFFSRLRVIVIKEQFAFASSAYAN